MSKLIWIAFKLILYLLVFGATISITFWAFGVAIPNFSTSMLLWATLVVANLALEVLFEADLKRIFKL